MTGSGEPAAPTVGSSTMRGTLLLAATRLIAALPEAPLVAAAESIGELWVPARARPGRPGTRQPAPGLRGTR